MGARDGGAVVQVRGRGRDLLVAAARLFVAQGVRDTTMEDIARAAGAGKATLYRHFENKAAVVDALVQREARRFGDVVDEAVAAAEPADALAVAVAAGLGFLLDHPMLTRGRDLEPEVVLARVTDPAGPFVPEALARLERLVADGVASGVLRDVEAAAAAEVLLRVVLSYWSLPPVAVDLSTAPRRLAFARDLVVAGLGARA